MSNHRQGWPTANGYQRPFKTSLDIKLTGMAGSGAGDGNRIHGEGASQSLEQAVFVRMLMPSVISV
jgi:hypothetical protein